MKIKILFFVFISFLTFQMQAQTTVKDKDGNEYKTVTIGGKLWMAENLRAKQTKGGVELESFVYPEADITKNGRLYSYEVAANMCPEGWSLPTEADWDNVFKNIAEVDIVPQLLEGGSTGLNLTLSGLRGEDSGKFDGMGNSGWYWVKSEPEANLGSVKMIVRGNPQVMKALSSKDGGNSVRCVKD